MFNRDSLVNEIAGATHSTLKQVTWTKQRTVKLGDGSGNIIAHDARYPGSVFWHTLAGDDIREKDTAVLGPGCDILYQENPSYADNPPPIVIGFPEGSEILSVKGTAPTLEGYTARGGRSQSQQAIEDGNGAPVAIPNALELIADPTQPSLSVQVLPWRPITGNTNYYYPGELTAALTPPSTGEQYYAAVFVLGDYTATEITYSTAILTTGRDLDETDIQECLAAKSTGSTPVRAVKLIGDQTAVTQADLDNDSVPLQQYATADTGEYTATVATTDATVTTLYTFTIPASTTFAINVSVVARRTGGVSGTAEDGAYYERVAAIKNAAGTATIIGSVAAPITIEDQAAWDCTIDVTGATARVRITGAVANNVSWMLEASVLQVST